MPNRYRRVVFLNSSEDFDRWYVEFDEDPGGGFEYLLQWEHGDNGEITDTEPWGYRDVVETFFDGDNQYVVAYNWNLSYVSLTQVISDKTPTYRDWYAK